MIIGSIENYIGECELCGTTAELRPYGENGKNICFKCGMANIITTRKMFTRKIEGIDINKIN